MTTKKSAAPESEQKYHIENCHFENVAHAANEHTRDAVVALAKAVEANANALAEAARALKGGNANMECAMRVGV